MSSKTTATPAEHSAASSGKEASKEPTKHGDKKAMDSDGASGSGLPGKHTCGKCNYSTRNKILYDNHNCDQQDDDNNLEEQTLIVLTVDEVKKFHCSECDVWAQGHAFEEHLMCHIILKPYQCLYCSQCFVNRRDIGRHVVKEHVGMKMNCALRALKRAKGLMKATLESGKFQFYACVAGKVPLPGDPDKSKSKQKKSKNETDSSSKNPTKQPVSSGGSAPNKDSSSSVKPSRHGSEDAASGTTTESSRTKTSNDASTSSKILQEPKGQHLSSNQATADSHHKPGTPSSISECRSLQAAEGRDKTGPEVGQKTAVSSEPVSPGTDGGTRVVVASTETADVTDGENKAAHSDNSGDTKAETVDTTVNRAKPTNIGPKADETGSVSASATSDNTQTSKDALDSSSELDKSDKLDRKSPEAMDIDCEKELTVKPATERNNIKDVSAGGEPLDTTTADNIGMDSNCKSDEMIDSGNRTEDGSPAAPEVSDSMSKTDNDSDPNSKTNQSNDNVDKMEDSSPSLQSTDNVLKGGESLPVSPSETNETEQLANTEDSMEITSSSKNEDPTTVISESSVSVTKEENPANETSLSEGKGEDKTDPSLETEKSANSPKETDEAMDTSYTGSDTLDCSNKTEQRKTDDTEEKSEDAEIDMEIGHQSSDADSKDKSLNENEIHEQSKDAVTGSDEKDSDTSELLNKNTDSHDARKVDSMEVEEAPSIAAENSDIVSTNTATAESENLIEKNSKLKQDSSRRDTSSDSLNKEDKEASKAKDLEFPTSNFDQSEEEETGVGLKIVAAFSLQGEGTKDSSDTDSQTSGSKARAERNTSKEPETTSKDSKPEASGTAPGTDTQESSPAARTLGPPSKPVPSSSFLGVSPSADPLTSQGLASRQVPQKNCFFFVCGFSCSFSSLTSPEFRDHLMLDHAGESSFRCFHCGYQSPSEDGLVRHISAHAHTYSKSVPLYICGASACKFGSNLVNDFITHQSAWHPELTTFHCHDCDERFDCIEDLLRHFEANFLHIINCPHCTAKTTERRTLLNHISAAHPGKPKMVSVAKQIVCRDRKLNSYTHFMQMRNQTVVPVSASSPGPEPSGASYSRTKSLVSILTQPIQPQERELTRQAQEQELTRQMQGREHRATSAASNNQPVKVETIDEDDDDFFQDTFDDSFDEEEYGIQGQGHGEISYMGSKPDDREVDNFKCQFCTFIARDRCRLEGHERCHGLPPSRKSRFKCMYCPQGFNNEHKFSSHVSCHPGLIKFSLYCCKYCDFDSNQRHIIVKHVRSTRDQVHMSCETNEEDMYAVLNKSMETRVLECNQCSYMTRHRKHLVAHLKREHSNLRKTGITVDCDIVEKYPSQSIGANRNKALEMALSHDNAAQLPVGDEGFVKENQARRFKCPICQYLVPRAADLKAHVKRHSEIGEITLVMFRCKYCSAASTAREIIYGHLMEKHLGKQIALVKRIVTIDTKGNDNGYAVTSMEDEDGQGEGQNSPEGGETSAEANKAVLVISDSSGETFPSMMQCPSCAFGSYSRKTIIQHVSNHHPEVSIMGRRQDNELYPLETTYTTPAVASAAARFTLGESLKGEILIVPDSQTFDEAVLCPKCDYATIHRRNIVLHLEQNHPEVSVMGRNDYPTFDGKGQAAVEANATGKDGMVIIGSGSLDEKIRCLYENFGDRMKCMICQAERPKKFFIHVHILRHLNILLWGCQFCSHKGLQKYKMMDHIKKVHPGRAFCIRYLPVNVEERVNQYLQNASMIRARRSGEDGDIVPSKSPTFSPSFQGSGGDGDLNTLRMKYKASQDRLSGCTIGSEELDMKLACLYSVGSDNRYRCVVCGQEFQRKFAVHRHIVQSHLRVNLIGCGYCELEGVERHIMMDHIIETHKNAPISMRNLAQNLENKVAEFLARMTLSADDAVDIPASELGMDSEFKLPEPPQLSLTQVVSSPLHSTPPRTPSPSTSSGKNQLNPNLLLLGRDVLHKHLACMIKEVGSSFCCEICKWDFPRKYAVHRHILMKHLKVGIIGCPYCSFEGVERYQVFTHIREDHKDADLSLRYLSVDLDAYVAEFMNGVANGTVDLYSKATPPWSMKKTPKKEAVSDEDSQEAQSTSSEGGQGLVVAMFGKKSGITIKEEPKDEDDDALGQEPMDREVNGDEGNLSYEMFMGVMAGDGDREVSSTSLLAANGTKAKVATDVQTNIRVITIKEKGFKRHICEKCKFTSLHRSNIVRHIYRVHEQYREHECPVCNYKTLSRVLIEQHLKNEHPGTPVPEAISSKNLKRKFDMSREELEYDSMKKCKAAATSKRREADLPLLNSTSTQLYACAYCNFETMTHLQIVQHTRENHSLGEPMKKEEEEDVKDKDILKQAQDDSAFENAVNTVKMSDGEVSRVHDDTLWQCFYCSFKTASEEDLKVHFAETHPGNVYHAKKVPAWRFVCRSCHVKTRAHSKMRYHLNRHINYRPYTCTTCGSFYPSPDQCRKHCRANSHNETFTYVKIPRKERRLQELLKECQEIAAAMARNPASAEAHSSSHTLSQPIPSKRKAKKSFPAHSRKRRNYEYDGLYSPRGTSVQVQREDRPKDDSAVMVCAGCDFSAQNVCDVWLHFIKEHQEQEFRWLDSSTGYICTETGEITNAKDVPPDLEAPPGPGYTTMSSRLLSCEHCEFTTSTVQAMKSHLRRHLPKRYLCPYCSLRCSRRDTINQHVRCGHKGRELWTIFFRLPEGFVADSDNAESNMDTSGPASSQGEDAGDQPLELADSQARSTAIRERIKCGRCDERRESVATVYKHHREHHSDQSFLWVDDTNGYTCNHSGVVIDAKEQSPHLFTQDGYSVEQDGGNVFTYCCKFCPFTSAFVQAIKSHMKSHLPHGFMCPYCTMTTNSKEKMMSHQSCMHREDDPWILHLRMPTESSSVSAVALESNDRPSTPSRGVTQYTCNECDYASENLYQYRLHLANHGSFPHLVKDISEDLPYRCGYCVYVAEDEGDFGAHIASHLERRNFRCSKCEFTAFKHSAVQTHIQTTHDETEEIEVIDLQAQNVSEQGGSVEEPQLVNLEPKVKVVPVNDHDLDREGLTLFSPPSTPDEEGQERRMEGEEMNIIGLETPSIAELDNQSDSTEEWGGNDDEASREGSPVPSDSTPTPPRSGNSILRLTLQGKLTGEYGIKRAVPVDKEGDLSDGSASGDSVMSAPSDAEDDPSPDMAQNEDDSSPEQPDEDDQDEVEEENDDDEEDIENDGDNANAGDDNCEDEEVENEVDEHVENGNEDEDVEMEHEEDRSPEEAENSVGFEPAEEEEEDVDDGEGVGEGSDDEEEECMEQGEEEEEEEGTFNT